MDRYDPNQTPDPDEWSSLDESEQMDLVNEYHRRKRIRLPNAAVHAVFHVVVENQIAMGDTLNASKTLDRLVADGLDRHEALHAVASVLVRHMHEMLGDDPSTFNEEAYASDLDALTVEKWREEG